MRVYVLNRRKEPLMPCGTAKAKKLLKEGKAKVVKRTPNKEYQQTKFRAFVSLIELRI